MDAGEDLPMISLPSDSTQVDLNPKKEVQVNAPEPRRNPTTQVPKPAAPAPAPADPRKASEVRSASPAVAPKPAAPPAPRPVSDPSASRPGGPVVKAAPPSAVPSEEEDPEKLLREYADRQKVKLQRLEQQLVEYKKVVAERDSLRAKVDALGKELQDAKRQIEVAAKSDEVIKDLQGKVDAAILSNSILTDDKEKLKKGLSQQTEHLKKAEDRASQAERSLAETEQKLAQEREAREQAEFRVSAALQALQGNIATVTSGVKKAPVEKPLSEIATRPMKAPVPEAAASRPAEAPEEKPAAPGAAAKPPAPARPPGRFSFLKK